MKVVINTCFGGFSVSEKAYEHMGIQWGGEYGYGYAFNGYDKRTDPKLVECVEALGDEASGPLARLKVVEIPDDIEWEIDNYDGIETIHEKHRSWG